MLRAVVIILGALSLGLGLFGVAQGLAWKMTGPILFGLLVLVGTIFERGRYRVAVPKTPGAGWERTGERFADPTGDKGLVDVWYNAATGERQYVKVG